MSDNGDIAPDISSIPNINIANPTKTEPVFFLLSLLDIIIMQIPINAKTGAKDSGFNNLNISPALS